MGMAFFISESARSYFCKLGVTISVSIRLEHLNFAKRFQVPFLQLIAHAPEYFELLHSQRVAKKEPGTFLSLSGLSLFDLIWAFFAQIASFFTASPF